MDKVTMVGRRYQTTWHCPCLLQDHPLCPTGSFSHVLFTMVFLREKRKSVVFQGVNRWLKTPLFMNFMTWRFPEMGLSSNHPWIFHGINQAFWGSPFYSPRLWKPRPGPLKLLPPMVAQTWPKHGEVLKAFPGAGWMWCRHGGYLWMLPVGLLVQNIAKTDFLRFWLGFLKELDFSGSFGPETSQNKGISWRKVIGFYGAR